MWVADKSPDLKEHYRPVMWVSITASCVAQKHVQADIQQQRCVAGTLQLKTCKSSAQHDIGCAKQITFRRHLDAQVYILLQTATYTRDLGNMSSV